LDRRKQRVEREAVSAFLVLYNHVSRSDFRIIRKGVPPEPDTICKDRKNGERIRIEVTTAYNEDAYAKAVWEKARGKKTKSYYFTRPDRLENARILTEVRRIIEKKTKKRYATPGRLLLVVLAFSQRFCVQDVRRELDILRIPKLHPFDEIYLMDQIGGVYCLFPPPRWIF